MEQKVITLLDTDTPYFQTLYVLEILFGLSLKIKNGPLTFLFEIGHQNWPFRSKTVLMVLIQPSYSSFPSRSIAVQKVTMDSKCI